MLSMGKSQIIVKRAFWFYTKYGVDLMEWFINDQPSKFCIVLL